MGWKLATDKRRKVQSTIPIVASTRNTLGESKKAKRSIALSKRSHLEVNRVDWHLKVSRSSTADFDPSRASIAELTRNRRAAVENCSRRRRQYKPIDSSRQVNQLAFHFYMSPYHAHHCQLYVCAYGMEMEWLEWMVRCRLDGVQQNENVTFFWLLLYVHLPSLHRR